MSTEYTMYNDSNQGRKPLPFAMAEKIDNAIDATMKTTSEGKRTIDVYLCWEKDEGGRERLSNIAFLDNGVGMDRKGLTDYGTYNLSQKSRGMLLKSRGILEESKAQDLDPLAMSGKIGYFGVGAQHSVFYMGNREHIMTRQAPSKKAASKDKAAFKDKPGE
ncbi:hypothetical protein T484DRAFT_1840252, partial [Baffinella frigidus]